MGALTDWLSHLRARRGESSQPLVPIDGMALRGTQRGRTRGAVLEVVTAWGTEAGLVLAQVGSELDTSETAVIPRLIDLFKLNGAILTIGAAGCHAHIAEAIVAKGGDPVLALKGNQPTLLPERAGLFCGHGRKWRALRAPTLLGGRAWT